MNDFEKIYKDMFTEIPSLEISAESVMNEARHRKMAANKRKKHAAMLLLFGVMSVGTVGTVSAAVNYHQSVIQVDEYGFRTGDAVTMAQNDRIEGGEDCGWEDETEFLRSRENRKQGEIETQIDEPEIEEIPSFTYDSIDSFRAESDVTAALPNPEVFQGKLECEEIIVSGDFLLAMLSAGDKKIILHQMDYRGSTAHASAVQYSDKVCNERNFTTQMGFQYLLVDSENPTQQLPNIHAAISVAERELILDFEGFSAEEVYRILENLDLTVYFR